MTDAAESAASSKEHRRKKQIKRMSKILAKAWELDETTGAFQEDDHRHHPNNNNNNWVVWCLTQIGQKIDNSNSSSNPPESQRSETEAASEPPSYRLGRHGWEDFARDLGGVYNRHIHRKTKHVSLAQKHLATVQKLLGSIDPSLAALAAAHVPPEPATHNKRKDSNSHGSAMSTTPKKRRTDTASPHHPHKKKVASNLNRVHTNKNVELAEREERAIEQLEAFIQERGGQPSMLEGFRSRVTRKGNSARFDVNYFNADGRRFRSMLEVGRFLQLVQDGGSQGNSRSGSTSPRKRSANLSSRRAGSGEQEAEKKKLRKELERLRKALHRATKALDDFAADDGEAQYPIDDRLLIDEPPREADAAAPLSSASTELTVQATSTRVPDIVGFPGFVESCIPDIIMAWDFLCTFQRPLNLTPIALDDFAHAMVYTAPEGQTGDDVLVPPVYVVEAHLGLIKMLLQDKSSDDWWWSVLETDETTSQQRKSELDDVAKEGDDALPPLKFDMAALLAEPEDPLITTSWLRTLDEVSKSDLASTNRLLKRAMRAALKVASNRWILAYLRKTRDELLSRSPELAARAIRWIVERVREARPDLHGRPVDKEAVYKARASVVDEVNKQMENLGPSVPVVGQDDMLSDMEEDEDDSDDSDDEDDVKPPSSKGDETTRDESQKRASAIPPKPLPTFVDMLLPPAKPHQNDEFVNPFTWGHITGAIAARVLHRKKRVWNEVDDSIRDANELPPLIVSERREREKLIASRVLTDCLDSIEAVSTAEGGIDHLCSGGAYLDLSPVQRLCILRLLIEATYDTVRVFDVVNGNYKQRMSALKALEVEQRRAKREAKEKAAADEAAAREKLALEAREKFLDEKRSEIRKLNEKSKEFSDEEIEALTDEDILEFDDDIKADYEALPGAETFSKADVNEMVARLQQEAAFETDSLRVLTMEELVEREQRELEEMDGQLLGFGGEEALNDPSLDKETIRSIERLQRDILRARSQAEKLPDLRAKALDQLRDAINDGTIKALRSAITAAKKAKLTGPDDETGGSWAVDLMRDAALELENAKQNKRVFEAQKDLVAKMNKCFIRSEAVGRDRFGKRFWTFDSDEKGHIWIESEFAPNFGENGSKQTPPPGFVSLIRDAQWISVGASDMEQDLIGTPGAGDDDFERFSRCEYHSVGFTPRLTRRHWGGYATEESLRALVKDLDVRGKRESELKASLKDSLEEIVGGADEKHEATKSLPDEENNPESADIELEGHGYRNSGDDAHFLAVLQANPADDLSRVSPLSSGIGQLVRVRFHIEEHMARYENGKVTGWKISPQETVEVKDEGDETEPEPQSKMVDVPVWRVITDRGHILDLKGSDLVDSMTRFVKHTQGQGYFENDASFFTYRNHLGRYCGKSVEASYAASPISLARLMVKKEGELYPKLKIRSYDNNWGGKSGARALWTNSMKDYAYDFETVRQGLLTLEGAFFDLTGEFSEYKNAVPPDDVLAVLENPVTRVDIELETIEKDVRGLWNNPTSRAVYRHIVEKCKTTGFLALALDLLCRNTTTFLQTHKLLHVKVAEAAVEAGSMRATRRMNAWQQQQAKLDMW